MRILHTSDWHLGAQLHEQSRLPEQACFLKWLKELMLREKPDALVVAGDIFDTCAPSNTAQNLYYDFLSAVFKDELCRRVVVIGGNHDSPSLLDAPGNVLIHLQARVIGAVEYRDNDDGSLVANYDKEVVIVEDASGNPGIVIGAIPYLRDADLRRSEAQEGETERTEKLKRGFAEHYQAVASLAREKALTAAGRQLPLVLTGHLYLAGGMTAAEKSERDLQVGNLGAIGQELLPSADYYALGHLHCPQAVGGHPACRYSGSPIAMGFGEADQEKSVAIVDLEPGQPARIRLETVPGTQRLVQLRGTPEAVEVKLQELVNSGQEIWVDIQVDQGEGDLAPWWNRYAAMVDKTAVRLLRWQNARPGRSGSALAGAIADAARLEHITPEKLFAMRLDDESLTDEQRQQFVSMFAEILQATREADTHKE